MAFGGFPHRHHPGIHRRQGQNFGADQPIIDHHIGAFEHGERAQRHQVHGTGAGPDQIHFAFRGHIAGSLAGREM
jgi:hypothetical protein